MKAPVIKSPPRLMMAGAIASSCGGSRTSRPAVTHYLTLPAGSLPQWGDRDSFPADPAFERGNIAQAVIDIGALAVGFLLIFLCRGQSLGRGVLAVFL